jgi:hypothetical protein
VEEGLSYTPQNWSSSAHGMQSPFYSNLESQLLQQAPTLVSANLKNPPKCGPYTWISLPMNSDRTRVIVSPPGPMNPSLLARRCTSRDVQGDGNCNYRNSTRESRWLRGYLQAGSISSCEQGVVWIWVSLVDSKLHWRYSQRSGDLRPEVCLDSKSRWWTEVAITGNLPAAVPGPLKPRTTSKSPENY